MAIELIRAMMPGIFYRRPAPEEPNFKNEGDEVKKGDVIGLIEVMKTFHQVQSDFDGKIISFQVDDSDAIAPGVVLTKVEV